MKDNITLIFGKSWTGKTARVMHELIGERRVVLVDPKCAQLAKLPGWKHLWPEYDPEIERWVDWELPQFFMDNLDAFRVVVHFRSDYKRNLELLCRFLKAVKGLVVAVDEIGLFCPPGPSQSLGPRATEMIVSGTHEGIQFVATAQRPSMVHGTIRSAANRMLFYRIDERNDKHVVANYIPAPLVVELETLADHVCIEWSDRASPFVDHSLKGKLGHLLPGDRFHG